jgi:hypothetical protein
MTDELRSQSLLFIDLRHCSASGDLTAPRYECSVFLLASFSNKPDLVKNPPHSLDTRKCNKGEKYCMRFECPTQIGVSTAI